MMIDLNDDHDLEVHIQELRRLDKYRKESARLRDEGYQILKAWKKEKFDDFKLEFRVDPDNSSEVLSYFMMIKVLLSDPKVELRQKRELVKKIIETDITIENIAKHSMSVILATETMQVLTMVPGTAFSKSALLCWYWIVREIFTAQSPDWSTGGGGEGRNNDGR